MKTYTDRFKHIKKDFLISSLLLQKVLKLIQENVDQLVLCKRAPVGARFKTTSKTR